MATVIWLLVWWANGNPDFLNPTMDASWVVWLLICMLLDLGSASAASSK